jgi:hypothetical protein
MNNNPARIEDNDLGHKAPVHHVGHQGDDLGGNEIYPPFRDGEDNMFTN